MSAQPESVFEKALAQEKASRKRLQECDDKYFEAVKKTRELEQRELEILRRVFDKLEKIVPPLCKACSAAIALMNFLSRNPSGWQSDQVFFKLLSLLNDLGEKLEAAEMIEGFTPYSAPKIIKLPQDDPEDPEVA